MGNISLDRIEKDKSMLEFLANISHELKTPINLIYSVSQAEEYFINEANLQKISEYNKIIKQNCYRLIKLTNNIIDVTKINEGSLRPKIAYLNIVEVVENIVMSVVPYLEKRGINIIFDTDIEEEYVNIDNNLMERIMLNLISNSIKYGNNNGNISISLYHDNKDYINVSVKDDGVGIPEEKHKIIFENFTQVDNLFTRKCEGNGMGLALVKSLVELQQGKIKLISEVGQGTEIIISIPITEINEVACTTLNFDNIENKSIIEKMNIEFSDIYW